MSYNGSGVFQINSSGQPVITGTVISSTAFNALTADLATGLSTAITKDGQTTTTARITFAQGVSSTLVTDATSATTGSIITAGGISMQKALWVGTTTTLAGALTYGGVALSNAVTGTGSMVLSSAPTLTGLLTAQTATFSGNTGVSITGTTGGLVALTVGQSVSGGYVSQFTALTNGGTYYFANFVGGTGGSIANNGTVTTYAATSDERQKNWKTVAQSDKRQMIDDLWIGDFDIYSDRTKTGTPARGFGVRAQQAYSVLGTPFGLAPPANEDDKWQAPSEPFGFLALWGVKDLYKIIDDLTTRLEALESK